MASIKESLGEQFACSGAQKTYDVRHAERLAKDQTLAETIEILKEDQTDAVWELTLIRRSANLALNLSQRAKAVTQRTSFADVETSKSRIIPESEVVRTSDELNGKAKTTGGAKTQKDLQQLNTS